MKEKNVALNQTLDQYHKKYRNRTYRLIKYTKKQVEDFDKQYGHYVFNNKTYSLEFNHYLLKDRKWALIEDTYYEIPKSPRFTWFRNLNAGVQAAISAFGICAVSSAVIFPTLAATVWNKGGNPVKPEPEVVITGNADFDKDKSSINLNADSFIILKEKGESIIDVKELKIGGQTITKNTDWNFDGVNKINILAHSMTSTAIEINVETKLETAKEKFIRILKIYDENYNVSSKKYTLQDVTIIDYYTLDNLSHQYTPSTATPVSIKYREQDKLCTVQLQGEFENRNSNELKETGIGISTKSYDPSLLESQLPEEGGPYNAHYEFYDNGDIEFTSTWNSWKIIKYNSEGYIKKLDCNPFSIPSKIELNYAK